MRFRLAAMFMTLGDLEQFEFSRYFA